MEHKFYSFAFVTFGFITYFHIAIKCTFFVYFDEGQTSPASRTNGIYFLPSANYCPHSCSSYLQDSDGPPRPEGIHPPVFSALRQSRVVSSTSEEEEALTEKFLKINCKYITDGKVRYSIKDAHIYECGHLFRITLYPPGHVTITCKLL